ncbi:MAG: hypothetical protein C3F10_15890 [Dehalococcoidia bacterium]|nr:MAG: hypothetical protein C3F10_15890 [Dehalococcoidia bacterium]
MTRILFMADIPDPKHSAELAETLRRILLDIEKCDGGTGRILTFPETSGHHNAIALLVDDYERYVSRTA